jgi:hypothetical protein
VRDISENNPYDIIFLWCFSYGNLLYVFVFWPNMSCSFSCQCQLWVASLKHISNFCSRVGTLLNYAHWNLFNDLPQFERHFWFHIYIYMLNFSTTIDRFCMTMNESLEWSLGWLKVAQTFLMYRSEIVIYIFLGGIVLYWNSNIIRIQPV